jgi:hypothetical protein
LTTKGPTTPAQTTQAVTTPAQTTQAATTPPQTTQPKCSTSCQDLNNVCSQQSTF